MSYRRPIVPTQPGTSSSSAGGLRSSSLAASQSLQRACLGCAFREPCPHLY